jgi:hypothetical protein
MTPVLLVIAAELKLARSALETEDCTIYTQMEREGALDCLYSVGRRGGYLATTFN